MLAMRACRSSIMIGKPLDKARMQRVLQHLSELDSPGTARMAGACCCPYYLLLCSSGSVLKLTQSWPVGCRPTMRHLTRLLCDAVS